MKTGGVNGLTFQRFILRLAAYMLKKGFLDPAKKTLLVLDNVTLHADKEFMKPLIEDPSSPFEFLFLPPYSPFLNPIEETFGLWKFFFVELKKTKWANDVAGVGWMICRASKMITTHHVEKFYGHSYSFLQFCNEGRPI
jgi:hypothetical protein